MRNSDELLEKAIELLQPEGAWCQGTYADYTDFNAVSRCMLGNLRAAAVMMNIDVYDANNPFEDSINRIALVPEIAVLVTNTLQVQIAKFNDNPNTTKEDVILVLKKALYEH